MINIVKQSAGFKDKIYAEQAKKVFALLKQEKLIRRGEHLTVLLTSNEEMQRLNATFRQKDYATNVLSFPQTAPYLGDIALGFEVLEKEALEQGKPLIDHFTHLVLHGCLHLLGYDHENEIDAKKMETLEIDLLKALNIANPYA